jgi:hypothetical protein
LSWGRLFVIAIPAIPKVEYDRLVLINRQ